MGFRESFLHHDDDWQKEYEKEAAGKEIPEKRKSIRIPMNVPVKLYHQKDTDYQNPEECILVDIGVGGACVSSEHVHTEDEILCLRVELDDGQPMFLLGQVLRVDEEESGEYRYGMLFAQVWDDELLRLNSTLENMIVRLKMKPSS